MSPFAKLIDKNSERELRAAAGAKRIGNGPGWSFPGINGLVLSPRLLVVGALTRIATTPIIGPIFAQGVAERIKAGEDAQQVARDLLAMLD